MKNVLILYFSGAGATHQISGLINDHLRGKCNTEIYSLENAQDINLNAFDALVVGTPVYHGAPSLVVQDFFAARPALKNSIPVFHAKRCENCYRCIHHCPAEALSLSKRKAPVRQLYKKR